MKPSLAPATLANAVVARMSALAPLEGSEIQLLQDTARLPRHHRAHREIQFEGQTSARHFFLLSGWACQARTFVDGRRQMINLLLPGDLVSTTRQYEPITNSAIVTLSDAVIGAAPPIAREAEHSALAQAYRRSRALREAYLFQQVARLGRLSAYERVTDLLLEVRERLELAGLVVDDRFAMPLTQGALGDTLGLTSVHVNRTLQTMRRDKMIDLRNGMVHLLAPAKMAALVSYRPVPLEAVGQ